MSHTEGLSSPERQSDASSLWLSWTLPRKDSEYNDPSDDE
ncbi:unnamed protein product [marine sediment metagenome]|uniref:Uncharacterized protein n=1 Tax=marine sediment metagenome TaxID=412755 RepID=X1NEJ5_9ZZZZ